jgi:hypothetical protein
MSESLATSTVLIELDALLDTRLATIASLGDAALDAAYTPEYHNRLQDIFTGVDRDIYATKYAQRDSSILANAVVTPMGEMLTQFTYSTLHQVINTPFHYQPKILLNIHPYHLTEDEIYVIMESIRTLTCSKADIQIIDVAYADISPSYVKSNISIMVMYEYYKWLEIHSVNGAFRRVSCPEVTLLGPAIYFTDPVSTDATIEAMEAMQTLAAPLIGLRLLPIENFSLVYKNPS